MRCLTQSRYYVTSQNGAYISFVSVGHNFLSPRSRPSFVSIRILLHQILHHLHTHLAVAQIFRVQGRAVHVPSEAVKRVAVILVFFWRRYRKVPKVGLHVLFPHPVTHWTQGCKFHSQMSAVCKRVHPRRLTFVVSIDTGGVIDDGQVRLNIC